MTEQPDPHTFDHSHADVSGGWLRAATFGAMDGLVTNTALIAGVGAAADEHTVLLSGVAGLVAGAFSMALGEFTSVTTANEQIDAEVEVERDAIARNPEAEKAELRARPRGVAATFNDIWVALKEMPPTMRRRNTCAQRLPARPPCVPAVSNGR